MGLLNIYLRFMTVLPSILPLFPQSLTSIPFVCFDILLSAHDMYCTSSTKKEKHGTDLTMCGCASVGSFNICTKIVSIIKNSEKIRLITSKRSKSNIVRDNPDGVKASSRGEISYDYHQKPTRLHDRGEITCACIQRNLLRLIPKAGYRYRLIHTEHLLTKCEMQNGFTTYLYLSFVSNAVTVLSVHIFACILIRVYSSTVFQQTKNNNNNISSGFCFI